MSPPEVWGPPIWTLFHTLVEKINEKYYHLVYPQLFNVIKQICGFLPCPECSTHATIFLSKIKIQNLNTKTNFKNIMYLFHNYVNKNKNKNLFNVLNMNIYKNKNLLLVIKNFISVYNTKGNMKLLTDSFQRQRVINDFRKWITNNIGFFYEPSQSTPIKKEDVDIKPIKETVKITHFEKEPKEIKEEDHHEEPKEEHHEEPEQEHHEEPEQEEHHEEPAQKEHHEEQEQEEHHEEPVQEHHEEPEQEEHHEEPAQEEHHEEPAQEEEQQE